MKKIILTSLLCLAALAAICTRPSFTLAGTTAISRLMALGMADQQATNVDALYSSAITASETPLTDNTIDLGSTSKQFRDEYIGRKIFLNSIETVAAGTSAQGDGPLTATKVIHLVTGFDETKVATLPACAAADVGVVHIILNATTNKFAKIFPASGSQINSLGANAAYTQGVTGQGGKVLLCACQAATQWYCA